MNLAQIQQIETFTKVAIDKVSALEDELQGKQAAINNLLTKEAAAIKKQAALDRAIEKAAKSLYDADYITEDSGESFIKKAQDNPAHLARIIERLCEASTVVGMGKVSSAMSASESQDPVIRRMNGGSGSTYSIVDVEE
jgi:DNA repair exonuclease SbcCD ATPase subunit